MNEDLRLIFQQDKVLKTSSFDLKGIESEDKEERRQAIYDKLVSPEGLIVDVSKTLEDGTQKKTTVCFRFHLDDRIAVIRISEPITKNQIAFIGSGDISGSEIKMVLKDYGLDRWQASKLTKDEKELLRLVMKKKHERYGIIKAATACFNLAAQQNNFDSTESIIAFNNTASMKARDIPDIENVTYKTTSDVAMYDDSPAGWQLITKIIRKPL